MLIIKELNKFKIFKIIYDNYSIVLILFYNSDLYLSIQIISEISDYFTIFY